MQDFFSRYKLSMLRMYTYQTMIQHTGGASISFCFCFAVRSGKHPRFDCRLFHFFLYSSLSTSVFVFGPFLSTLSLKVSLSSSIIIIIIREEDEERKRERLCRQSLFPWLLQHGVQLVGEVVEHAADIVQDADRRARRLDGGGVGLGWRGLRWWWGLGVRGLGGTGSAVWRSLDRDVGEGEIWRGAGLPGNHCMMMGGGVHGVDQFWTVLGAVGGGVGVPGPGNGTLLLRPAEGGWAVLLASLSAKRLASGRPEALVFNGNAFNHPPGPRCLCGEQQSAAIVVVDVVVDAVDVVVDAVDVVVEVVVDKVDVVVEVVVDKVDVVVEVVVDKWRLGLRLLRHSFVRSLAAFHFRGAVLVGNRLGGVGFSDGGHLCVTLRLLVAALGSALHGGRFLQREVGAIGVRFGASGASLQGRCGGGLDSGDVSFSNELDGGWGEDGGLLEDRGLFEDGGLLEDGGFFEDGGLLEEAFTGGGEEAGCWTEGEGWTEG
ncbi:hypothetical protein F7725_004025 [Dissostichus mawsoni]|uniref:Uncharacterized protein n=1 Tax=Dissostichus mawsoni TaxID=36200 RepID=A0A7J5YEH2_DISMA|nr:hypothetical protein F7725_004025 [Dissostichus mawsoni]